MNNFSTFTVATPTDHEIVVMRSFKAPRAVVFEAWTKAEHVAKWWDPGGAPLAVCEIDLRPNGAFRWINAGGSEFFFAGIYRDISPPEWLTFMVRVHRLGPDSLATLQFSEDQGTTLLTMTIECRSREDRDALLQMRMDAGTGQTLENLAKYLAGSLLEERR